MPDEKRSNDQKKEVAKPVEEVRKFKFAYIDPASMAHAWFLYELPGDHQHKTFQAYNADGLKRTISKNDIKMENIVPLK